MPNPTPKVPPRSKSARTAPRRGADGDRGEQQLHRSAPFTAASRPPGSQQRRTQRGRSRRGIYVIIGVVAAAAIAVVLVLVSTGGSSAVNPAKQAAVNFTANGHKVYGGLGPEGVPVQLGPQLGPANAGLSGKPVDGIQCNAGEQLAYHHHVHLAIFVNGAPYSVPIAVGMQPPAQVVQSPGGYFAEGANCFYWLHVHATDGIVHIESPDPKTLQLGQFFDIWHQPLSSGQVGPYKGTVTATVNGAPWTGNPQQILLTEHAQIVLNVGGPVVTPPPITWTGTGL